MLVLSRRKDESVIVNGEIEIVIVDIDKNGNVKLGVKAPKDVTIYRKEIYEEIKRANAEAVNNNSSVGDIKGILKVEKAQQNR